MGRIVAWDIDSAVIATNNGDGTWGTNYPVKGVISVQMELEMKSGEQPGDGILYAILSKVYAGNGTFQFVNQENFSVIASIIGSTVESSGGDFTNLFGRNYAPYFSLCGRTYLDDAVGDYQIWIPKLKVTEGFSIGIADNEFVLPEFTARAVVDEYVTRNSVPQIAVLRANAVARAAQIPMLGVALS
jgi:hypothetical protein